MKNLFFIALLLPVALFAQNQDINCKAFLYKGDTLQYKACLVIENVPENSQFRGRYQEQFDKALEICPYFSYAYKAKSTAYLKSGDFVTWKRLIDKAVLYDEKFCLGYRGWCRYQFFRDYQGAINDLERLDSLVNYDIGYSQNGQYHLNIAKGICYSAINQKQKAIEIFNQQINTKNYEAGLFDYYQLGVTYFELKDYDNALKSFEKQAKINPLADNEYFRCKIYKMLDKQEEYKKYKEIALKLFKENKTLYDVYTHHFNKVYYEMIVRE